MAITNNGTKVNLKDNKIPTGYTKPIVTTFADHEYLRTVTLSVDKATVENATPAITLTNIIGNGTVGITKQVDDILAADYLATATVDAYAELTDISTNIKANLTSDFYNNTAVSYVCNVRIYIKTS